MANNSNLLSIVERFKAARVLCIGDVMLDHYIYGQVDRVSPEAPIPVLCIEREMKTLGGAGNVLRNLRALGAAASFISVVGNDEAGREIGRLVEAQDGEDALYRRQSAAPSGRPRKRDPPRSIHPRRPIAFGAGARGPAFGRRDLG